MRANDAVVMQLNEFDSSNKTMAIFRYGRVNLLESLFLGREFLEDDEIIPEFLRFKTFFGKIFCSFFVKIFYVKKRKSVACFFDGLKAESGLIVSFREFCDKMYLKCVVFAYKLLYLSTGIRNLQIFSRISRFFWFFVEKTK
jgi:hypothetical protein